MSSPSKNAKNIIDIPGGSVDLRSGLGRRAQETFQLTDTEVSLLRYLAQRPGQVIDKSELLDAVWSYHQNVVSRAVDTAVRRLRAKMGDGEQGPQQIHTTRGQGYSFHPMVQGARPPRAPRRLWGREALLERIGAALEEGTVCLTGPPGVGKTALVAWFARSSARQVAWVDGLACDTEDALLQAIASALSLADATEVLQTLARWVEPVLLVLDGTDRLSESGWRHIDRIDAPNVHILVTQVGMPPSSTAVVLPVPPLDASQGVQLLLARAAVTSPDALDVSVVRQLVDSVGGLPLGIEVAASALAKVDLGTLVERLRTSVPEPLQLVLSAAIERQDPLALWALTHLCVFEGSFTAEAAMSVLDIDLEVLEGLLDTSLVSADHTARRYRLLRPTIALLMPDWLSSRDRERIIATHRAYYVSVATDEVAFELDNIRAAAAVGPKDDAHARLLLCLHRAWVRGLIDPERLLADGAPLAQPELQIEVMTCHAEIVGMSRPYEQACALLETARAFARRHGLEARALTLELEWCMMAMASRPSPGVRESIERCKIALGRLPVDEALEPVTLNFRLARARLDMHDGRLASAREGFTFVWSRAAEKGHLVLASAAVEFLAVIEASQGLSSKAVRLLDDGIELAEQAQMKTVALIRRDIRLNLLLPEASRAHDNEQELLVLETDVLLAGLMGLYGSVRLSRAILALNAASHAKALALLDDSRALLAATGRVNLLAFAEGLQGVLAHDRGRWTEAAGHYARAHEQGARPVSMWSLLHALASRQANPGTSGLPTRPQPADKKSYALALACEQPDLLPRGEAFYDIGWWPALDRILRAACTFVLIFCSIEHVLTCLSLD